MRPRRLFQQIYFHFLGVLIVVGLAFGGAFFSVWKIYAHQMVERQTRHAAQLLADRWSDPADRAISIQRVADVLDVDVTVRNAQGALVGSVGALLPPLGPREAHALQGGPIAIAGHGGIWYGAAPIVRDHAVVGVLQACKRFGAHDAKLWRPGLFVVGVLIVVALGTAPLARRISRPVERLTEASRRLGDGNLSYRVPVRPRFGDPDCAAPRHLHRRWRHHHHHRSDELDELARAWNEMADRVQGLVRGQKELLANVSHELRSPLARLRVALELLPRDANNARLVDDIGTDIVELDRLIEDVLTMSRLEATGLPARIDRVELRALFQTLVERAAHDPALVGRAVTVAEGAPVSLLADGGLLKRAIWNLIENAAKYGAPPIVLAARSDGDRVQVSVTDDGPGIAREDRERVFSPFFRGDRAHTPGTGGFGLGLALARRVADVHGGTIRAEAALVDGKERGCRIVIDLPARPV